MNDDMDFTYEYSSETQKEIRKIREKYSGAGNSKLDELRRLDKSVGSAGTAVSVTTGIVGVLLLGLGMSCSLEWYDRFFILGIVLGIIGILIIAAAYPLNNFLVKRKREKLAPQILRLTEELSKGEIT